MDNLYEKYGLSYKDVSKLILAPRFFFLLHSFSKILNNITLVINLQLLFYRPYYCKLLLSCIFCHFQYQVVDLTPTTCWIAPFISWLVIAIIHGKYHIFSTCPEVLACKLAYLHNIELWKSQKLVLRILILLYLDILAIEPNIYISYIA